MTERTAGGWRLILGLVPSVYLPGFLLLVGEGMLIPTLPLFLRDEGLSYTAVSVVLAGAGVGALVWNLPAGVLLSHRSTRTVMLAGGAAVAGSTLLLAVTDLVPLLVLLRVVAGCGTASWMLSRQTYLVAVVPPFTRGRAMSLFGGLVRVAYLIGPIVGGVVAQAAGYRSAFVVAGLVSAASLVSLVLGLRGDGRASVAPAPRPRGQLLSVVREHARTISVTGVGQLLSTAIRVGRLVILPLHGAAIGLTPAQIGVVIAASSAVDMVLFPVAGVIMDRWGRLRAIVPCFVTMGVGMMLVPLAGDVASLVAVAVVIGIGNGLGAGTMLTVSTDLAPERGTSEFLAALAVLRDSGAVLAPLIVGLLADRAGLGGAAVVLGALGVAGAGVFAFGVGETMRPVSAAVSAAGRAVVPDRA